MFLQNLYYIKVPLEVADNSNATNSIIEKIESMHSKFSEILTSMLLFLKDRSKGYEENGPPIYDPCAVAFLIDPSIYEYRLMHVSVETISPLTYGMTVCDVKNHAVYANKPKNVNVCLSMNAERFWEVMFEAFGKANASSLTNQKEN